MPWIFVLIALFTSPVWGEDEDDVPTNPWESPAAQAFLQSRFQRLIEAAQRRKPPTARQPVYAPSCILTPTASDFFDLADIRGARGLASKSKVAPLLDRPAVRLNDVFEVIRATKWGSAVLKKFLPRFGFEIKIEHFTDSMKNDEWQRGRRAAALFDVDSRTIFVNRSEKIGTVAPILLHEIVHSLDKDFARAVEYERRLWQELDRDVNQLVRTAAERSGKTIAELLPPDFRPEEIELLAQKKTLVDQFRDVRVYRAERVAYDLYHNVYSELVELFPAFYRPPGKPSRPASPYTDEDLVRIERLSVDTIVRYQNGLCRTAGTN